MKQRTIIDLFEALRAEKIHAEDCPVGQANRSMKFGNHDMFVVASGPCDCWVENNEEQNIVDHGGMWSTVL